MKRTLITQLYACVLALAGCTSKAPPTTVPFDATVMMSAPVITTPPASGPPGMAVDSSITPVPAPAPVTAAGGPAPPPMKVDAGTLDSDDDAGTLDAGAMVDAAISEAGPWRPPDLHCAHDDWELAPGLLLALQVDYVADRDFRTPMTGGAGTGMSAGAGGGEVQLEARTLSSAGQACRTANNRSACETALANTTPLSRHLVTTKGDTVTLWPAPAALKLIGLIDTPADALWWALANYGATFDCSATVSQKDGAFTIHGIKKNSCYVDGGFHDVTEMIIKPGGELGVTDDCQ